MPTEIYPAHAGKQSDKHLVSDACPLTDRVEAIVEKLERLAKAHCLAIEKLTGSGGLAGTLHPDEGGLAGRLALANSVLESCIDDAERIARLL